MILKTTLAFILFTTFQPVTIEKDRPINPKILHIESSFPKEGAWVRIPKGTQKISFQVKAVHTETVLFWLIPTGTGTWN